MLHFGRRSRLGGKVFGRPRTGADDRFAAAERVKLALTVNVRPEDGTPKARIEAMKAARGSTEWRKTPTWTRNGDEPGSWEADVGGAVTLRLEDVYRHDGGRLRVHGRRTTSTHEFRRFVQSRVRKRVRQAFAREQLHEYVTELMSTGFATANLGALPAQEVALAPWEIGEVLAEVLLQETEGACLPWPPSWDKRSATASLPGPDLIGFLEDQGSECFLFGEVKTSDADDVHASVIYGEDGLRGQIERLLNSEDRRQLLISWLCVRAKGRDWQPRFDRCLAVYLADPSQGAVVAVLLRGRAPREEDLQPVRAAVEDWTSPYRVMLFGYYLPVPIADLPAVLEGTVERP
jgi:hypothetical protein